MNTLLTRLVSYKKAIFTIAILVCLVLLSPFAVRLFVVLNYGRFIHPLDDIQPAPVAIVFGAQVYENGRLSDVLRDRMDVAVALYHAGKVQKLLLSGDNRFDHYNEPERMMDYAIAQGVLAEDIQPDYAGRRSYDTCYRAKHIFEVETAVLVTQQFHLYRSLMLCRQLGVKSEGVSASLQPYILDRYFSLREIPATNLAIWDLLDRDPAPVMGETIPIQLD